MSQYISTMRRSGDFVLYQSAYVTGWFWWMPGKNATTFTSYLADEPIQINSTAAVRVTSSMRPAPKTARTSRWAKAERGKEQRTSYPFRPLCIYHHCLCIVYQRLCFHSSRTGFYLVNLPRRSAGPESTWKGYCLLVNHNSIAPLRPAGRVKVRSNANPISDLNERSGPEWRYQGGESRRHGWDMPDATKVGSFLGGCGVYRQGVEDGSWTRGGRRTTLKGASPVIA
jgi:hypothetical protein